MRKGSTVSEDSRQKISDSLKRYYANGGVNSRQGKTFVMSEEVKKKISQAASGEKNYWYGKKLTDEHRKKLSESHMGHTPWNKGLGTKTPENKRIRRSKQFSVWRTAVFKRDNYTCQACGQRGGVLHPHHIKPFAQYVELRFEVSNGQTLCAPCHRETDTWGSRRNKDAAVNFTISDLDEIEGWSKEELGSILST